MSRSKDTEMRRQNSTDSAVSSVSTQENRLAKQQSKYEKLDKTKFYKHYRPDDSFFEKKNREFNFKSWLNSKCQVAFDENLPLAAIGDLPSSLKYLLGTLGYLLLLFIFLAFLITGYTQTKNTRFMSLDPTSGDCTEVTLSHSQKVLGDDDGVWSGANEFSSQHAKYALDVVNFERTTTSFETFMRQIEIELRLRGQIASISDPASNLVVWMTWKREASDFVFSMTGSPRVIFGRQHQNVALSSRLGVCDATAVQGFNHGAGTLFAQYPISNYRLSATCVSAFSPFNQGYISSIDGPLLKAEFDVTSMVTAIAVNTRIISTDQLLAVNASFTDQMTAAVSGNFVDNRSPFMYPITCTSSNLCILVYDGVFLYPIFFHYGETNYDGALPDRVPLYQCKCPLPLGPESSCNAMDLVAGFIFYNTKDVEPIQELIMSFNGNYNEIVDAAYNASIASLNSNIPHDASNFDFCTLSYGSCSLLLFNMFDRERAVSPFYFVLQEPACADSFTTPNWRKLVDFPPFPLVENYYECTAKTRDAFIDSLGIAVGNATFWVPLMLCLALPLVYLFLNYYKDAPSTKREYGDDEMEEASRLMGLLLLRVRDGKFQSYDSKLVEHFVGVMEALKLAPALATDAQIRKVQHAAKKTDRRQSVAADPDDSDAEIDALDDIANAGHHPTGNKAYYDKIRRASVSNPNGTTVDVPNGYYPNAETSL